MVLVLSFIYSVIWLVYSQICINILQMPYLLFMS